MSYHMVCPLRIDADGKPVAGHGTDAGYSAGGWSSHAQRCPFAAESLGLPAPVATGRGPQTADEFLAAAAAKATAKGAIGAAVAAEPVTVILADGRKARIIA